MLGLENPIHLAFLLVLLLLVFGAKRLPEMGRSLGSGLRGFKDSLSGDDAPASIGGGAPADGVGGAPADAVAAAPAAAAASAPAGMPTETSAQLVAGDDAPATAAERAHSLAA